MSQYGYGYGGSHTGYQPSQPHLYSSTQQYSQPPFHSNDVAESQSLYSQGAVEAFEYNQTAIPGLSMGFPHNAATWHQVPQNFSEARTNPSPSTVDRQISRADGDTIPGISTLHSRRCDLDVDNDLMEEGELSEGELEDIYEPEGMEANRIGRRGAQPVRSLDQNHKTQLPAENLRVDHERTRNSKQCGRERSGSYSPYLSPREIQSSGLENGASNAQTPRSGFYDHNQSSLHDDSNNGFPYQSRARDGAAIVLEFKKHAQDAILRLWPLNVRYQNYVEEGIDRALLDQLFTELGLELDTVPRVEQPTLPVLSQVDTPQRDVLDPVPPPAQATPIAIATEPKVADSLKDKSEERKDRIARLLAAKGSKATVVNAGTNKPDSPTLVSKNPSSTTKSDKTKTQSEKSKLIQQKMEALMKAREATAKASHASALPVSSVPRPGLDTTRSNSQAPVESPIPNDHLNGVVETADSSAAPPIPGLFLSSNAPSPAPNQRKRPVAADLNENSTPPIQKRPFGQNRESRPFLIDVSDDEDDAEMEIDSPELRPSSVHRPVTPGSRALSLRDNTALPENASRSAGSMIDLASMNKKIEDMKRRIAEAEARKKKAKESGSDSPLPQSEIQSKEGSVEVSAPLIPAVRGASTTAEVAQNSPASSAPQPGISPDAVTKLPKVRDTRLRARSSLRARVASERLPIVTAQRMECEEQLKHFQSEVDRVKKEIENKLVEEERLKRDATQTEPVFSPASTEQDEPESGVRQEGSPVDLSSQAPILNDTPVPAENDEMDGYNDDVEQDAPMDESHSESADSRGSSMPPQDEPQIHEESLVEHEAVDRQSPPPASSPVTDDRANAYLDSMPSVDEPEEDVTMDEADTSSEEESAVEDESDDYEPTDAGVSLPDSRSPLQRLPSPQRVSDDGTVLETSDTDSQGLAIVTPVRKPISTGAGDTESESNREVETRKASEVDETAGTSFIPYETPLQYFKAYRFHPRYSDSVAGGLRSLTYSNSIDATREVCPDQLTNGVCPRGSECQFQHFEDMQLPDDQIIVQLGASGNPEAEHQDQYVAGLRELLTDFRNRKVKDFQAISQGLIEYRARFLHDKTKILPLSGVTL